MVLALSLHLPMAASSSCSSVLPLQFFSSFSFSPSESPTFLFYQTPNSISSLKFSRKPFLSNSKHLTVSFALTETESDSPNSLPPSLHSLLQNLAVSISLPFLLVLILGIDIFNVFLVGGGAGLFWSWVWLFCTATKWSSFRCKSISFVFQDRRLMLYHIQSWVAVFWFWFIAYKLWIDKVLVFLISCSFVAKRCCFWSFKRTSYQWGGLLFLSIFLDYWIGIL